MPRPTVVLICHARDRLDSVGLASWLAATMNLVGIVAIHDGSRRRWRAMGHERRRSGWLGLADAMLYRLYASLCLARADAAWVRDTVTTLRERYPVSLDMVPRLDVSSPNDRLVEDFLAAHAPDLVIARCKTILRPAVFERARVGTFVLHPGICPEYRNAHGCFWALARRDLTRVGMTLLRVDKGIDTGPIFLHASCAFDEVRESHSVIQHRVVFDNLDAIHRTLTALCREPGLKPLATDGRASAIWGQPRLSTYLRWKRAARRSAHASRRLTALS